MPFKDKEKRKRYMKAYMKDYRKIERQIIKEYRMKFPDIDAQIRRELGFRKKRGKKK